MRTVYRHEAFQLWESNISSFFISKLRSLITINKDGINVMQISTEEKRYVKFENSPD